MSWPRLLLIADHGAAGGDDAWLALVAELVGLSGLSVAAAVQLRVKDLAPAARRRLLTRGLAVARRLPALVNGTAAEAVELGADGVHWPEAAIPRRRRRAGGPPELRGASVHSPAAAELAVRAGATHVVFAPVYAPRSKAGAGRGLDALAAMATACPLPVLALGGVDVDRVRPCLRAGAAGVAVVGALLAGPAPASVARRLADALAAN